MALDTREKRMNAARAGRPWMRARHAVGATDQQSRIASGHGYGGNALSPSANRAYAVASDLVTWMDRRLAFATFSVTGDPLTPEYAQQPRGSSGWLNNRLRMRFLEIQ